jgi:DNA-binding NarL/FixJ family response regulator
VRIDMTIYVIDDHPLMRDAIVMLLRRLRPDMRIVELGLLAEVQFIKESASSPSVFFLDLHLPDAPGFSGVHGIKASFPSVPLAVYSASPASEMGRMCIEAGADLYVEKTASSKHIAAALRMLLPKLTRDQVQHTSSPTTV